MHTQSGPIGMIAHQLTVSLLMPIKKLTLHGGYGPSWQAGMVNSIWTHIEKQNIKAELN